MQIISWALPENSGFYIIIPIFKANAEQNAEERPLGTGI